MSIAKDRIDKILFERGLAPSRERARALVMAGMVVVGDHLIEKPGTMIPLTSEIRLKGEVHPFVSRGGLKLEKALEEFRIDVTGLAVMDVGASTGGFTDCLLQRGARRVFAVDVGYGQLAWKLRQDPRVVNLEKTNIRYLSLDALPEVPDMAVVDASFISLAKVLPAIVPLIAAEGTIVALIKPQFEVGRGEVGKGGVVRDTDQHRKVIESIVSLADELQLDQQGVTESPVRGPKGNREFLIYLRKKRDKPESGN